MTEKIGSIIEINGVRMCSICKSHAGKNCSPVCPECQCKLVQTYVIDTRQDEPIVDTSVVAETERKSFTPMRWDFMPKQNPLDTQVGGDHYKTMKMQPLEYILANNLGFCEGAVVKYISRRKGNRIEDLKKARHFIEILIAEEEKRAAQSQ